MYDIVCDIVYDICSRESKINKKNFALSGNIVFG